jgi:hypothetical protein
MTGVSSLFPDPSDRTRMASSSQFVDDQIDILRRRVADAVDKGALGLDEGAKIAAQLDALQKEVDDGTATGRLKRADLRDIGKGLHAIAKQIVQANRAAADAARDDAPSSADRPRPAGGIDISA